LLPAALLLCAALAACTPPKCAPTLEEQAAERIESVAPRATVAIEPEVASASRSSGGPRLSPVAFVEAPRPLKRPPPRYPPSLADEATPGRVLASFEVNADGRTEAVQILQSSHPLFAQAVQAALAQWRFAPARAASGKAVAAQLRVPFVFQMDD
jgi:protein TonB